MKPRNLTIHPCCPKRLLTALRRAKGANAKGWNFSVLARQLGINKGSIHKLVTKGIEPHAESARLKLFLPKHPHKRAGDCNRCGKRVEVMKDGTLESHVHPDGTYCPGSETRNFLKARKLVGKTKREAKPPHWVWWNKLPPETRDKIVHTAYWDYYDPGGRSVTQPGTP